MRIRIHHGAEEVGGNCIEVQADGRSVLLDLGMPLQSAPILPPVRGLTEPDEALLGVVLSHPHLDHYGLLPAARADLPVWLGEGALRLLSAAAPFTRGAVIPQAVTTYQDRQAFEVGPFRITPYQMDHSAFDAYALLVEADGKRLFYTGDFRGHGRKAGVFRRFLADPPTSIDVLLMEGTSIGRTEPPKTEAAVETEAAQLMGKTKGLVLLGFGSQNIDRVITFLRACMRSGRLMVIDAYTAALIEAAEIGGLERVGDHRSLRVFLPKSQKQMIVRDQRFDLIEPFRQERIFPEQIAAEPGRYGMVFRNSMIRDLDSLVLEGGALIYALWPGYLDRDRIDLRSWAKERGVSFHLLHSSGHAYAEDLQRMVTALQPTRLIPIHTDQPQAFTALADQVQLASNGAWIEV